MTMNEIEEEDTCIICNEVHVDIDPNHGYDLQWIAHMEEEMVAEDSMMMCWDSPSNGFKKLTEFLADYCKKHNCIHYPDLIDAFVGTMDAPEFGENRIVYCAVKTIQIIAKESQCNFDKALEDFEYNYRGNGGKGVPIFIDNRSSKLF